MAKSSGGTRSQDKAHKHSTNTNDFKSKFGFKNVGSQKKVMTFSGSGYVGTKNPTKDDVQQYLDTGKWNQWSGSASAKNDIMKEIATDMSQRGYDIRYDKSTKSLVSSDMSTKFIVSKSNKAGTWSAKMSVSSNTVEKGGFNGALRQSTKAYNKKHRL